MDLILPASVKSNSGISWTTYHPLSIILLFTVLPEHPPLSMLHVLAPFTLIYVARRVHHHTMPVFDTIQPRPWGLKRRLSSYWKTGLNQVFCLYLHSEKCRRTPLSPAHWLSLPSIRPGILSNCCRRKADRFHAAVHAKLGLRNGIHSSYSEYTISTLLITTVPSVSHHL